MTVFTLIFGNRYQSSSELQTSTKTAGVRSYGGGGYVLRLKGYIDDLKANIQTLKDEDWVNNRTRALIVQFSVYNAQVYKLYGFFFFPFTDISGKMILR